MSKYIHCPTCKDFHYDDKPCAPIYYVFHEDYLGVEGKAIHANSHFDAAIKYAEYYNPASDYSLVDEEVEIAVVKDDIKKIYKISAMQSVDYFANEVDIFTP